MQLTVREFNHDDPVYKFHLDMGDRVVIMAIEDIPGALKWISAIQCSKATAKEQLKSKLPVVKNIYWAVKAIDKDDDGDEQKLITKAKADFDKINSEKELESINNLK